MLCHWLLALFLSSLLSLSSADPIRKVNQNWISYGRVDRTEVAAVLSEISTIHASNSLLVVVNEYQGTELLRQSICYVIEEFFPRSYDMRAVRKMFMIFFFSGSLVPETSTVEFPFIFDTINVVELIWAVPCSYTASTCLAMKLCRATCQWKLL